MDINYNQQEASSDDTPESQRAVIRPVMDAIALEVGVALRDARLEFPVYLTVPRAGDSLATIATPLDPS
jgi:hypothetical protein